MKYYDGMKDSKGGMGLAEFLTASQGKEAGKADFLTAPKVQNDADHPDEDFTEIVYSSSPVYGLK